MVIMGFTRAESETCSAECMVDLAKEGKTQEQILDALRILPLVSSFAGIGQNVHLMFPPLRSTLP